jgi:hypothetical protein
MSLTFFAANLTLVKTKVGFFMSNKSRNIRKIGIWLLLLAFVFATIILAADAPPAIATVTFALLFFLELLFIFSLDPQLLVCTTYRFGIRPRSPPNR